MSYLPSLTRSALSDYVKLATIVNDTFAGENTKESKITYGGRMWTYRYSHSQSSDCLIFEDKEKNYIVYFQISTDPELVPESHVSQFLNHVTDYMSTTIAYKNKTAIIKFDEMRNVWTTSISNR